MPCTGHGIQGWTMDIVPVFFALRASGHMGLLKFKLIKNTWNWKLSFTVIPVTNKVLNGLMWLVATIPGSTGREHSHHCRKFLLESAEIQSSRQTDTKKRATQTPDYAPGHLSVEKSGSALAIFQLRNRAWQAISSKWTEHLRAWCSSQHLPELFSLELEPREALQRHEACLGWYITLQKMTQV